MHVAKLHGLAKLCFVSWIVTDLCSNITYANPVLANIASGKVDITQGETVTNVKQMSDKAIVNWSGFNLAANESINFIQPEAGIILNRIDPSVGVAKIYGQLHSNAQVILINNAGIYFGPQAVVNVGSIMASTANIGDHNFLTNNYKFAIQPGLSGAIVNDGHIATADHGFIALMGAGVVNNGVINANLGQVVLAAGNTFTVSFGGDNLFNFAIDSPLTQPGTTQDANNLTAGVVNNGVIHADGGTVQVSVKAAQGVLQHAINMSGSVQAHYVVQKANTIDLNANAVINLDGGDGDVLINGDLDVSGATSANTHDAVPSGGGVLVNGNSIELTPGATINADGAHGGEVILFGDMAHNSQIKVAGKIHARATTRKAGLGGHITIHANAVALNSPAEINVSGSSGGGSVSIDNRSRATTHHNTIVLEHGATINADATDAGDGGKVVLVSDKMLIHGAITARGGANGGNGGFVETSGDGLNIHESFVDSSAPHGHTGTWLIDPYNLLIADNNVNSVTTDTALSPQVAAGVNDYLISNTDLAAALELNDINTFAYDTITLSGNLTWHAHNSLTLNASNSITINNSTISGGGDLILAGGATLSLNQATILTTGSQVYNNSVVLQQDAALQVGGNLTLTGLTGNNHNLTVNTTSSNTAQAINLSGSVSGINNLVLTGTAGNAARVTATLDLANVTWQISGQNQGGFTVSGINNGTFTNIANIGSGVNNGNTANLTANTSSPKIWNITGNNAGNLNTNLITFSNIANLTGSSNGDSFNFNGGSITGALTLNASSPNTDTVYLNAVSSSAALANTISNSTATGYLNIRVNGGANVQTTGNQTYNKLRLAQATHLTAANILINNVSIINAGPRDLTLTTTADTSTIEIQGSLANSNINNLIASNNSVSATKIAKLQFDFSGVDWALNGSKTGSFVLAGVNTGTFNNINTIASDLSHSDSASITATTANNVWNLLASHSGNVSDNRGNILIAFTNIGQIIGNSNNRDSLVNKLTINALWYISSANAGHLSDTSNSYLINFNNIGTIQGNSSNIDQMLNGSNISGTWSISGANSGTLALNGASINFSNIPNLTGSSNGDQFSFADTGSISGSLLLRAASGKTDTLTSKMIVVGSITSAGMIQLTQDTTLNAVGGNISLNNITGGGYSLFLTTDPQAQSALPTSYRSNITITGALTSITQLTINNYSDPNAGEMMLSLPNTVVLTINGKNSGSFTGAGIDGINNHASFSNINTLDGGINANNVTLTANTSNNTWLVTGSNSGTLSSSNLTLITFSNIANLTGSSNGDSFNFNGGSITGALTLNAGNNTSDTLSGNVDAGSIMSNGQLNLNGGTLTTVNAQTYNGLVTLNNDEILQVGGNLTLTGLTGNNHNLTVNTTSSNTAQAINLSGSVSGINNLVLTGTAGNAARVTATLDLANVTWQISGQNQGGFTVSGINNGTFTNIANISAGSNAISARLVAQMSNNTWNLSGGYDGWVQDSANNNALLHFSNIATLTGYSDNRDLVRADIDTPLQWNISMPNAGEVSNSADVEKINFTHIGSIQGGVNDILAVNLGVGSSGANWAITGSNAGTVTNVDNVKVIQFSNISNLSGSSNGDSFNFNGGSITGALTLNAGNNTSDTLSSNVDAGSIMSNGQLNLNGGTLTTVNAQTYNGLVTLNNDEILQVGGNLTLTGLTGNNHNLTVNTTSSNTAQAINLSGSVSGINNLVLTGTAGNAARVTATLDLANVTWQISGQNQGGFTVSGINNGTFTNIANIGSGVNNGNTANLTANTSSPKIWNITGNNAGNLNTNLITFSNIANLTGSSNGDSFNFNGGSITGALTLNAGNNTSDTLSSNVDAGSIMSNGQLNLNGGTLTTVNAQTYNGLVTLNNDEILQVGGNLTLTGLTGNNHNLTVNTTSSNTAQAINLSGSVSGINNLVLTGTAGNAARVTATLDLANVTWQISGQNQGGFTVSGINNGTFTNIANIGSGVNNGNTANLTANTSSPKIWNITGNNAGNLNTNLITFSNIANLTGSSNGDSFNFNGGSITGALTLNAGNNTSDTLSSNVDAGSIMSNGQLNLNGGTLTTVNAQTYNGLVTLNNDEILQVGGNLTLTGLTGNNHNLTVNTTSSNTAQAINLSGSVSGINNLVLTGTAGNAARVTATLDLANVTWQISGQNQGGFTVSGINNGTFTNIANIGSGVNNGNTANLTANTSSPKIWNITGNNAGNLNTNLITFSNIANLTGSSNGDSFNFNGGSITGALTLNAGNNTSDTLSGNVDAGSIMSNGQLNLNGGTLTTVNAQTYNGLVTLNNDEILQVGGNLTLTGLTGNNHNLTVNTTSSNTAQAINLSGSVSGINNLVLTGTAGNAARVTATLDLANVTWQISGQNQGGFTVSGINNGTFTNIANIGSGVNNGNTANLTANTSSPKIWNITGNNAGNLNTNLITFSNIANLTGSSNGDSFNFNGGSITGALTLNAGNNTSDTLSGNVDAGSIMSNGQLNLNGGTLTTVNAQTYNGLVTLNNDEILQVGGNLTLTGLTGNNHNLTVNTTSSNTAQAINLSGSVSGINNLVLTGTAGNAARVTATLDLANVTWQISGQNQGGFTVSGINNGTFTNIANIGSGVNNGNTANLTANTSSPNIWNITGNNAGNLNTNLITFSNIANLTGSSNGDSFNFNGGSITGALTLNAGNNTSDTLSSNVDAGSIMSNGQLNLNGGTLTTVNAQTYNGLVTLNNDEILQVGGNLTLTGLTGNNHNLTVNTTSSNTAQAINLSGSVSGINNLVLTGTAGNAARVTATLDLANVTWQISGQNQGGFTVSGINNGTFTNIANIGSGVNNGNTANLTANTSSPKIWNITGNNAGNLNTNLITFSNIANLTGSSNGDSFNFNGGSITGALTLNAGNNTSDTLSGNVDAGSIMSNGQLNLNGGTLTTVNAQTYNGAVTLINDIQLISNTANLSVLGDTIVFNGTLNSAPGTQRSLTINASGSESVLFGGNVGSITSLNNLIVNPVARLAANVTTARSQTYNGAVTLINDIQLISNTANLSVLGDTIVFNGTLNSAPGTQRSLTINASGSESVLFGGNVGSITSLNNLIVNPVARLAANVTTARSQTYNGAVTLINDIQLISNTANLSVLGDTIVFNGTLNSAPDTQRSLTINASGSESVLFGGNVGSITSLNNLIVNPVARLAANVTTARSQTYNGAVTLINDIQLISNTANLSVLGDTIVFNGTLNSAPGTQRSLTINASGSESVLFGGNVGSITSLNNLIVNPAAELAANVTTAGSQTYLAPITISGSINFTAGSDIVFSDITGVNAAIFNVTELNASANALISIASLSNINSVTINIPSMSNPNAILNIAEPNINWIISADQHSGLFNIPGTGLNGAATTGSFNNIAYISGGISASVSVADGDNTWYLLGFHNVRLNDGIIFNLADLQVLNNNDTLVNNTGFTAVWHITGTNIGNIQDSHDNPLINFSGVANLTGSMNGDIFNFNGGQLNGSLNLNASVGKTDTVTGSNVLLNSLTTSQGNLNLNVAAINTTGSQTYNGPVSLNNDISLTVDSGNNITDNVIAVNAAITSAATGVSNLTINSPIILANNVRTTGTQNYNSQVMVDGDITISAGGGVNFHGAIDSKIAGNGGMTIAQLGQETVYFGGNIGANQRLNNLIVNPSLILAGNVTTVGSQSYNNLSLMNTNTTITAAGNISLTGVSGTDEINGNSLTLVQNASTGAWGINIGGVLQHIASLAITGSAANATNLSLQVNEPQINWQLAAANSGSFNVATVNGTFSGIGNIDGGTNAATNNLVANTTNNIWLITGANVGNVQNLQAHQLMHFSNIATLTGDNVADLILNATNSSTLWEINALNTGSLTANGQVLITFNNIPKIQGGASNIDQLTLNSALGTNNTWNIVGTYAGNIVNSTKNTVITFSNIGNLLDDITQNDTLVNASNSSYQWNLTSNNTGNIVGNVNFVSFPNLQGGLGGDSFIFNQGISLSGNLVLNAMLGKKDTLSGTITAGSITAKGTILFNGSGITTTQGSQIYNSSLQLNQNTTSLQSAQDLLITGVSAAGKVLNLALNNDYSSVTLGGTFNLDQITILGSHNLSHQSLAILTGDNQLWNITGNRAGYVSGVAGISNNITFSNIENITGGSGNVTFKFWGPYVTTGGLIAGGQMTGMTTKTLDYNLYNQNALTPELMINLLQPNLGTVQAGTVNVNSFTNINNIKTDRAVVNIADPLANIVSYSGGNSITIDNIVFSGVAKIVDNYLGVPDQVLFNTPTTFDLDLRSVLDGDQTISFDIPLQYFAGDNLRPILSLSGQKLIRISAAFNDINNKIASSVRSSVSLFPSNDIFELRSVLDDFAGTQEQLDNDINNALLNALLSPVNEIKFSKNVSTVHSLADKGP